MTLRGRERVSSFSGFIFRNTLKRNSGFFPGSGLGQGMNSSYLCVRPPPAPVTLPLWGRPVGETGCWTRSFTVWIQQGTSYMLTAMQAEQISLKRWREMGGTLGDPKGRILHLEGLLSTPKSTAQGGPWSTARREEALEKTLCVCSEALFITCSAHSRA